ncbi:MAG TPA: hypothetical protein VKV74_06865 [Bryobacteraceae bacterium]|nr:hypothetical protein [Bryobacteraceae bacterium]
MLAHQVSSLQRLGYTENEARFLSLVAAHSGYFVQRQFSEFIGKPRGGTVNQLVRKLTRSGHAEVSRFLSQPVVYHIHSMQIYARLDQMDSRNHRDKAPLTVKRKLICLDFVLEHPALRFLETQSQRVDYCTRVRGAALEDLPVRWYSSQRSKQFAACHFVEKFPIYISQNAESLTAPVVHFVYIDEGAQSLSGFETFLRNYHRLFLALRAFEVIYATNDPRCTGGAERLFQRCYPETGGTTLGMLTPEAQRLAGFFEVRRKFEARDFGGLSTERIVQYRAEKQIFSGGEYEDLYHRWMEQGDAALRAQTNAGTSLNASFRAHILTHDYGTIFGK